MAVKEETDKLSIILYEKNSSPKYFEIKKTVVKFFVFGMPFISIVCFFLLAVGLIYFKEHRFYTFPKEPVTAEESRQEGEELKIQNEELKTINQELNQKLTSGTLNPLQSMSLFVPVPGQQDMGQNPMFTVEEFRAQARENRLHFTFNIVNNTKENFKLAGHLFVLMKDNNSIHIYPEKSLSDGDLMIKFQSGEPFATSRFRPVEAVFPLPQNTTQTTFKVLIFTRDGDLLFNQTVVKDITI